jgi:hypothetical protein
MTIHTPPTIQAAVFVALAFLAPLNRAQGPQNKSRVEQELVRTEFGFFQAWKAKDLAYFREHIPDNGIFWSDAGTFSRDDQLEHQPTSPKNCTVDGYSLSEFGVLQLAAGTYLLTYRAEQYATCSGDKLPLHINGSSLYILKQGRWQSVYRAEVSLKNQG